MPKTEPNVVDLDGDEELIAGVTLELFSPEKKLEVVYRAHLYSPELLKEEITIQEALLRLVVSWGLQRKGEPIPLTAEGVASVPTVIAHAIWDAIREDFTPSPKWQKVSASTSSTTENAAAAPSSTAS